MDRHNMTLFLENDTNKLHPAGFDVSRRNIFDPEDDPECVPAPKDLPALSGSGKMNNRSKGDTAKNADDCNKIGSDSAEGVELKPTNNALGKDNCKGVYTDTLDRKNDQVCSRDGCSKKPRFDSIFCSDSCGVSTLEGDLLKTLEYASKLHPSVLR